MQVTITIDRQILVDLIVTALEGGSNYWYMLDNPQFPESVRKDLCFSEKVGYALHDNPEWILPVYDVEADDIVKGEELGFASYDSCQKAFSIMADVHQEILGRILNEGWDAGDADVFFQLCVLGEVVYG